MQEFIDKSSENAGTPLNRDTMMALQGFASTHIFFLNDGSIKEVNSDGYELITIFNDDGSIEEKFSGEKIIKKTTIFKNDGSIEEVIS